MTEPDAPGAAPASDRPPGSDAGSGEPLVSIGLPVRNGADYLEESIRSLLVQTYRNIELVIRDNRSTDGTREICERFALADDRVRYELNEDDIGGAANHNLVFLESSGVYFRWAAHDDVAEPTLIERCVEVLQANPDVVLCHTDALQIDEHGIVTGRVSRDDVRSSRPSERMAGVALVQNSLEEVYGVIRSDVLSRTGLHRDYTNSDRTLMAELALRGVFHNTGEALFRKRFHPANEYLDWRARMTWYDSKYEGRIVLPWWLQLFDYVRVVGRVPLSARDRRRCYGVVTRWVLGHWKKLLKDVLVAATSVTRSRAARAKRSAGLQNWS